MQEQQKPTNMPPNPDSDIRQVPKAGPPTVVVQPVHLDPNAPQTVRAKGGASTVNLLRANMLKTLLLTLALIIVSIGVVFAIQFSVPSDRTPLAPISVDSEDEEYDNQSWFDDFYADEGIIEQPVDTPDPPVVNDNGGNIVEKPPISGGDEPDPTAKTYTIEFTFNGCYSPANQSVKVGDKVVFVNSDSKKNMWPASNDHPSHDLYSGFDSGGNVAPGGNFSFTFTKKGNWGYHDHNKLSCGGIITVN